MGLAEKLRDFIGFEEYEEDEEREPTPHAAVRQSGRRKIVLVHLRRPEDAKYAAASLLEGSAVIFSVEGTPRETARRLVDFVGGAAFAKDGQIKHIAQNTYLLAPYDAELIGRD